MTLMSDAELLDAIKDRQIVEGLSGLDGEADPFAQDSPVQPSSVDFTVGRIILPDQHAPRWMGRLFHAATEVDDNDYDLEQGETAVLVTRESFNLPSDIAAITFPPSRVAFQGLIVTNPGHIDPGFKGQMRFTVINMARDRIKLEKGMPIATALFFAMKDGAAKHHGERGLGTTVPVPAAVAKRLSPDFLDFERRAETAARAMLTKWGALAATAFIAPLLLLLLGSLWTTSWWPPAPEQALDLVKQRVARVEGIVRGASLPPTALRSDLEELAAQLEATAAELDKRLVALESAAASKQR